MDSSVRDPLATCTQMWKIFFFFKSTSGEEDVISLEIPMYNKGICLVTSISLHPKQLFVSDTQSFFQA